MSKANSKNKKETKNPLASNGLYLVLITVIFFIIYQFIFNSKLNLGGDNAGYYILGKSISEGLGFTNIHRPEMSPHAHFPPGYPAVMSAFMIFSDSINFIKGVNGLFMWGSSILLFFLLLQLTGNRKLAFAGSLLSLFNMHLLSYSTIMMSEIPFLFFTTLGLYLFVRTQKSADNFLKNPAFYGLILTIALSYHIRSIGIAMVAGISAYLLFSKQFKYLLSFLAGFILVSLPWYLHSKSVSKGGGYMAQVMQKNPYRPEEGAAGFDGMLARFWENLQRYLGKEIPNGLFPFVEVDYKAEVLPQEALVGLVVIGFIIFGLVKLPRFAMLLVWCLLGNFAILLLWPEVWFGIRFMLPLIPILLFLMAFGGYKLLEFIVYKLKLKIQVNPLLILLLVFLFIPQVKNLKASAESPIDAKYRNYFDIASYANLNLPESAIIACRKPTLFYLYGRRKVTNYRNVLDYTEFLNHLDSIGVTHVVIDQLGFASTGRYLVPAIQANTEKFRTIYQLPDPDTYLLEFNNNMGYKGQWKQQEQKDENSMVLAVKEGYGTYRYPNGRVYEGQWKNNKMHGTGKMTFPNGTVQQGVWANGIYQQQAAQLPQ